MVLAATHIKAVRLNGTKKGDMLADGVESNSLSALPLALRTIVEALRGVQPYPDRQSWDEVMRLADIHGVSPLLHEAWWRNADIPAGVRDHLAEVRRMAFGWVVNGLVQRDELLRVLQDAGIPALLLKGGALATIWYRDLSLRTFIDLDILVPEDKIDATRTVLVSAGYQESSQPGAAYHTTPILHPRRQCSIEIHRALVALPLQRAPTFDELFHRSMVLSAGNVEIRTLSAEDTLLHLCLHLVNHLHPSHGWQLRYLYDIARHCEAFPVDWDTFTTTGREWGADTACAAVLGLALAVTGSPAIPPARTDGDGAAALLRYPIPATPEHDRLAKFLVHLRNRELVTAWRVILGLMIDWDHGGQMRIQDVRLQLFLLRVRRLAAALVARPRDVTAQVGTWVGDVEGWGERDQLVASLFPASDANDGRRSG